MAREEKKDGYREEGKKTAKWNEARMRGKVSQVVHVPLPQ